MAISEILGFINNNPSKTLDKLIEEKTLELDNNISEKLDKLCKGTTDNLTLYSETTIATESGTTLIKVLEINGKGKLFSSYLTSSVGRQTQGQQLKIVIDGKTILDIIVINNGSGIASRGIFLGDSSRYISPAYTFNSKCGFSENTQTIEFAGDRATVVCELYDSIIFNEKLEIYACVSNASGEGILKTQYTLEE